MNEKNNHGKPVNKDNFLLRIKKKLSDRHIYSVMVVILAVIVGIAIYFYKEKANYESYLQNTFQQSFYESIQYIDGVDNLLAKINVTNQPEQRVRIFTDLYREASAAQSNMGRLPYNQEIMSQISRFLTQLSDFSYAMLIKSADDEDFTDEEVKHLKDLSNYSNILAQQMDKIKTDINDGNRINWKEIQKEGEQTLQGNGAAAIVGSMAGVQKEFQNYPSLIYDGPFSDHIRVMESKFLKDKEWIRKEKALEIATNFLGKDTIDSIQMIFVTDTKELNVIPVYRFRAKPKGVKEYTKIIDITQQGGYPLWMLSNTVPEGNGQKISSAELEARLKKFIDDKGYKNMDVNYFESMDDTIVYNFTYKQNGVIIYPDLIKIKASLANGEILGFEAAGYIVSHVERKFPKVNITESDARGEVNKAFKIEDVRLAVIPLTSKREVMCYEVRGSIGGKNYLVYINASSGKYENILQLIKSESGVFTQ